MRIRQLLSLLFLFFFSIAFAGKSVLNIYGWSGYIPDDVLQQFTKQTGIQVNYSYFDSNEMLYARLKADPKSGYDIIIPTSYYLEKMRKENMLYPLDHAILTNFHYLNPVLLNKSYDPNNLFSIPYAWGTSGIAVNDRYYDPKKFTSWKDLWNPDLKDQILIMSDVRDVFGMAFLAMGYPFNDTHPQHIRAAYEKLRTLMPNVKLIATDEVFKNVYTDEDVNIGMAYGGDIYLVEQENPHVQYIYPKEGFGIWIDCLAIPKYAPHPKSAMEFINFIMQPEIAKEITMGVGYSTPNLGAIPLLPKAMRENPLFNPDNKTLARGQVEGDIGAANLLYQQYWQLLQIM